MDYREIAKSIADELTEHPERWTQGCLSRDSSGKELYNPFGREAVCWCLEGLFMLKDRPMDSWACFTKAVSSLRGIPTVPHEFNDAHGRTQRESR